MRGEVSQARQGLVSTPKPLIYTSQVLRGETVFFFFQKNTHPEKSVILGCFFERNPLPGSAPARHLEPDALILTRFGGVRGQISHKTYFLKIWVPHFDPKCSGPRLFVVMLARAGSSVVFFYPGYFSILVLPVTIHSIKISGVAFVSATDTSGVCAGASTGVAECLANGVFG